MRKEIGAVRKRRERKELPTAERLAKDLEDLDNPKLSSIILKAKKRMYDEFDSPDSNPIFALACDLEEAGFGDLARQAMNGRWNATVKEGIKWLEKETRGLTAPELEIKKNWRRKNEDIISPPNIYEK